MEVLFCSSSPGTTRLPASATVVALTPGLGFPPSGRVAIDFKADGEVLARGVAGIHMQQAAYSQPANYSTASVFKANVSAGRSLTTVDECVVSGYWDANGEPVSFEERTGIVTFGSSLLDGALLGR
ncbi:hypothetical protein [Halomonas sp. A29]|uniref:hypothetical protein n=1 Tax=Halomonas sp. A29 TaxID=3102786 RepID=UPI00398B78CA